MIAATESTRTARWPWILMCCFGVAALVALVLSVANRTGVADDLPFVVAFGTFGVVGALIVSRAPGNRIGSLFLWAPVVAAAGGLSSEFVTFVYDRGASAGVGLAVAAVVAESAWIVGILPALILLPLLFPDGRLPSQRWRPLLWLTFVTLLVVFVAFIVGSPTLTGSAERTRVPNPFFVPAMSSTTEFVEGFFFWVFLAILAASVISLVLRFRRSRGVERQQIKWFALAVVFFLAVITATEILLVFGIESSLLDTVLVAPAFLFLPASVGVAILRYRLYDLDVVVRKTLLYTLLVAVATAVYVVVVVGAGTLVGRESPFLTMVAAVIVAVGFQPARTRLAHVANRIVYGRRATPYEVLTEFSERVGTSYATEDVLPRMAQVLADGTGADVARIWLLVGNEFRAAAAWPADAPPATPVRAGPGVFEVAGEAVTEVRDRGELLGALSLRMPASDPMSPSKQKLVRDLAAQAGLVLRNVRLVEDVRASRQRLVAAQDEERRRLERNIHDGAQQQLVALAVKARLARQLTERDPAKATEILGQIEAETQSALEDLRDLARGIYPPLLADRGLVAALEAQSRKASMPVSVEAGAVGRYPADVEATVYFCALEALQNVAKYAGADRTVIRLSQSNGSLAFEVVDEGRGFDPNGVATGSGLQGMADRLAAVGGSLEIRSAPGSGTTVAGRVPVSAG
ncbi:MAG TPA: histidine kinase [Actinomycetota bacterium]|nr:histidine kinase [Actinomycetota bacterium]